MYKIQAVIEIDEVKDQEMHRALMAFLASKTTVVAPEASAASAVPAKSKPKKTEAVAKVSPPSPTKVDSTALTLEGVRAKLGQLRTEHPKLDLATIFASFGVKRLPELDSSKYEALLAEVEAAVK